MDEILKDLKEIRENVEHRLNGVLSRAESLHKEGLQLEDSEMILKNYQELFQATITSLRETIALNNARCAELARQLTVLPATRVDLMVESIEKRLETLEADFLRSQRQTKGHE